MPSSLRNNVCKKLSFLRASFGDLLLNYKQKRPLVSRSDEVTEVCHLQLVACTDTGYYYSYNYTKSLTVASLVQVNKALNGPDLSLFCCDTGLIRVQLIFF